MNIVHYLERMWLADGGVMRAVLDLCSALSGRGHDVTLMSCDLLDVPPTWMGETPGLPKTERIGRIFGRVPSLNRGATRRARQVIARADVVHLHMQWDPVCARLAGVARRLGVPYVVGIHGTLDDWCMAQKSLKKKLYLALAARRLLEEAAAVHCTAQAELDQSSKWYPGGRPVVLPLIFDLADYEELPGPELAQQSFGEAFAGRREPVILYVSRLHPKKGLEQLIRAMGRLRDEGVASRLLIAGTGDPPYERSLCREVEQLGLAERVSFLGFVSGREKVSLYEAADIFVLPTNQENWGFVLIESLACGTPVVTTRGVDIWSELESSGGAVIVEPTPPAIASAMADLIRDRAKLETMQRQARAWVLENLNVDRVVVQYERFYESLCTSAAAT